MADVRHAVTIVDLEAMARRRLPEFAFAPVASGSGDGDGVARNVEAFAMPLFGARALVDVNVVDQTATVFGQTYASPFGISAVGYAGNLRVGADERLAEAAVEANIPFMLSGASTASIETIARIAPRHVWQQLYAARDQAITDHFVGRARDAGVSVLVYTVDSPVPPKNHWLARAGIGLPANVRVDAWPYVLWQAATHPGWSLDVVAGGGLPRMDSWAPYAPPGADTAAVARVFQSQVPNVQTWAQVEHLRRIWPGRLVLKGVVHPEDARRGMELGADAVTVSNHGGNKLEVMAAALDFLPAVRAGLAPDAMVMFDGGIRRGSDVVAAMALGAGFCFVGRATLYGVIADGKKGADRAIAILREEIGRTLAQIGAPSLGEVGPQVLHSPRAV